MVKKWVVAVRTSKRRIVRFLLPVIVLGIVFTAMIPAPAEAVAPGSGATTNLESSPAVGAVEVDELREVPFIAIAVALIVSVGLVISSLGPRGLAVLTALGDRGRYPVDGMVD